MRLLSVFRVDFLNVSARIKSEMLSLNLFSTTSVDLLKHFDVDLYPVKVHSPKPIHSKMNSRIGTEPLAYCWGLGGHYPPWLQG